MNFTSNEPKHQAETAQSGSKPNYWKKNEQKVNRRVIIFVSACELRFECIISLSEAHESNRDLKWILWCSWSWKAVLFWHRRIVTSMLVTDVEDQIYWWQVMSPTSLSPFGSIPFLYFLQLVVWIFQDHSRIWANRRSSLNDRYCTLVADVKHDSFLWVGSIWWQFKFFTWTYKSKNAITVK